MLALVQLPQNEVKYGQATLFRCLLDALGDAVKRLHSLTGLLLPSNILALASADGAVAKISFLPRGVHVDLLANLSHPAASLPNPWPTRPDVQGVTHSKGSS